MSLSLCVLFRMSVCVCIHTHTHTHTSTHTHPIPRRPGLDRGNMSDTEQHVRRRIHVCHMGRRIHPISDTEQRPSLLN
jgi:hypothetical protein